MKKLITQVIFFSSMSFLALQAQVPGEKSFGISASASVLERSVRGYLEPFIGLGKDHKQLFVAPTIMMTSNLGYKAPQTPRLTGTHVGYRFWPGTLNEKWDVYLSADLRMQRIKDLWSPNIYVESEADYREYQIKTVELLMENYLGYGVVFNISKTISLSQGVGLGWYWSFLDTPVNTSGNTTGFADLVDYRGYDNIGMVWNVRFEVLVTL